MAQNRLTVANQKVQEFLVLLHIVGLLLADNYGVIAFVTAACVWISSGIFARLRFERWGTCGGLRGRIQNRVAFGFICIGFFLLLELCDVSMAQVEGVTDQFLAVETCHHTVLQCFFIPEELAEYSTEL